MVVEIYLVLNYVWVLADLNDIYRPACFPPDINQGQTIMDLQQKMLSL